MVRKALKINASKKKSDRAIDNGTDWDKLRRMSAARISNGIAADSDARVTDEKFWKRAEVVLPAR
jgi:hypothetical protein